MLRRSLTLTAGVLLSFAAVFTVSSPAQAQTVDLTFGPLSIGDYCHAKVSSSAWIGFYQSDNVLRCYASGSTSSALVYAGQGDPYLACKYLTSDVISAAFRGSSDALVCRAIR
ncbi:hypothetical protein [Microtetraspora glauca]|uniref:Uncharacterized protein n=1 Tax=Microtetraspora glauca TaxID=1996 RepID=A0ABV3GDB9_MICGL